MGRIFRRGEMVGGVWKHFSGRYEFVEHRSPEDNTKKEPAAKPTNNEGAAEGTAQTSDAEPVVDNG